MHFMEDAAVRFRLNVSTGRAWTEAGVTKLQLAMNFYKHLSASATASRLQHSHNERLWNVAH